jgi:hypothetical protein
MEGSALQAEVLGSGTLEGELISGSDVEVEGTCSQAIAGEVGGMGSRHEQVLLSTKRGGSGP